MNEKFINKRENRGKGRGLGDVLLREEKHPQITSERNKRNAGESTM